MGIDSEKSTIFHMPFRLIILYLVFVETIFNRGNFEIKFGCGRLIGKLKRIQTKILKGGMGTFCTVISTRT